MATGAASVGLSHFVDIPWPAGLAPIPGPRPKGAALPAADVLVVTWTVDEGHALSRVLTPGFDSQPTTPGNPAKPGMGYWKPYTKNYVDIAADMSPGCPARNAKRLGTYWTTRIGPRRVTLFKSDSHMSQDGPKLPNATVWRQIIEDCRPDWVITTGTGGRIGPGSEVGDVLVSRFVTFDCQRKFVKLNAKTYACHDDAPDARFAEASSLFGANAKFLPPDNKRAPEIIHAPSAQAGVLTTDFFGFDNSDDTYKLAGKGGLSEMGDAVVGMVCKKMGAERAAVRHGPQRLRPADQFERSDARAADQAGRRHLQGVRPLEHGLQCHRLLGHRRRPLNKQAGRDAQRSGASAREPDRGDTHVRVGDHDARWSGRHDTTPWDARPDRPLKHIRVSRRRTPERRRTDRA